MKNKSFRKYSVKIRKSTKAGFKAAERETEKLWGAGAADLAWNSRYSGAGRADTAELTKTLLPVLRSASHAEETAHKTAAA